MTDGHTLYVLKHMYRCMFRVFFSQQSANIYSIFGLRKIAVSYGAKPNGRDAIRTLDTGARQYIEMRYVKLDPEGAVRATSDTRRPRLC